MKTKVKIRYSIRGGHVHIKFYTALESQDAFSYCGSITVRATEWPSIYNDWAKLDYELRIEGTENKSESVSL